MSGAPSPRPPNWLLPVWALVIALCVVVASAIALPPADPHASSVRVVDFPPARLQLAVGGWVGSNVSVRLACPNCSTTVPAGSTVQLLLNATPDCDPYGCVASLRSVALAPPFRLLATDPILPAPLARSGTEILLDVATPSLGGVVDVNGSAFGAAPVEPVVITGQSFVPENATNGSMGWYVYPDSNVTYASPGGVFDLNVTMNNTSWFFERVNSIVVDPPFGVRSIEPGLPFELNSNTSGFLELGLVAPATSGNYTVSGVLQVGTLPQVAFSSLTAEFTNSTSVYVSSWAGVPNPELPGEETNCSFVFTNPSATTQELAFVRLTGGGVFFVNSTPNGTFAVNADGSLRYYVTLSAEDPPGTYALVFLFWVPAEPVSRGRARRARGAPAPGRRGPAPAPARRSSPRRRRG
jgi:hypothetical protein